MCDRDVMTAKHKHIIRENKSQRKNFFSIVNKRGGDIELHIKEQICVTILRHIYIYILAKSPLFILANLKSSL